MEFRTRLLRNTPNVNKVYTYMYCTVLSCTHFQQIMSPYNISLVPYSMCCNTSWLLTPWAETDTTTQCQLPNFSPMAFRMISFPSHCRLTSYMNSIYFILFLNYYMPRRPEIKPKTFPSRTAGVGSLACLQKLQKGPNSSETLIEQYWRSYEIT